MSGVALALLLLSGPVGLPAAILIVVGLYLTNDSSNLPGQRQLVGAAAGFGVAFILFSSALLTQPSSIYKAPIESLNLLWNEHIANIGDGLQLNLLNVIINEPLLLLLAIVGVIWKRECRWLLASETGRSSVLC